MDNLSQMCAGNQQMMQNFLNALSDRLGKVVASYAESC